MPIYEYDAKDPGKGCNTCRNVFEVRQTMSDEPLTVCPECGGAIQKVISQSGISTQSSTKTLLSDKNLKRLGFTKLVNEGGGKFRKI